jgi:FkbM family methyltransferase
MIDTLKEYIKKVFQKPKIDIPNSEVDVPKKVFFRQSYSQSGEDMIVSFLLGALSVDSPRYIDIGAHHPEYISNTAYFYNAGYSGINIEPNPKLFKEFEILRPRDINLNIGVSDVAGELDFFVMSADTLSTFSREGAEILVAEHGFQIVETIKVKVRSVSDILSEYLTDRLPEFLTIDAEGVEEKILNSINFDVWKPLVICCETISYSTNGIATKNAFVLEYLQSKGYMVYADTYINSIFVLETAWRKG